jgi:hypothetical protein
MPASRAVVSVPLRALGDLLHTLKAGRAQLGHAPGTTTVSPAFVQVKRLGEWTVATAHRLTRPGWHVVHGL